MPSSTDPTPTGLPRTPVLDSFMTHREAGAGQPVVFLHGNPTSSYVWRDVLPHVAGQARALAPDLIGMGASGKPDIGYRYADHARYLDAWFAARHLPPAVLVGYDWGGVLALDRAARHPDRVRGVVVFETFLRPMRWAEWPPQGAALFRAYRTPGVGEAMVLERDEFVANSFAHGVRRGLTAAERAVYDAAFPTPATRRPVLQWPRELPIDGEPADVAAMIAGFADAFARTTTPILLLTFGDQGFGSPAVVDWARAAWPTFEVAALPPAGHHAPEDVPHDIGRTVAAWLTRHGL